MQSDHLIDDNLAKRNLVVLVFANMVLGSQMPMLIIVGGLAGLSLAPNACLATLGISVIYFGGMTTAPWLSALMARFGRRAGLAVGALGGLVGALLAGYAILVDSFALFIVGSYFSGIYQSSHGFMRFAATDTASDAFRPKAIAYTLAGGLAAAIIGPQLVKVTFDAADLIFLGTYLTIAAINFFGVWIYAFLKIPLVQQKENTTDHNIRTRMELIRSPDVLVSIICAMVAYSLMTLMMTSSPLAMIGSGFTEAHASDVVSAHVLAMFIPSFFTGHLIARFGERTIVAAGLIILAGAGVVALSGIMLHHFFGAMILLGVGWNFGFIGATSMLAKAHSPSERGRVQGLNDLLVFGSVTLASLASGGLLNCAADDPIAGWSTVSLAMLPFLALAGGALIWLRYRRSTQSRPA